MSENLKLTLSTSHAYEVATFSGGTASWTPNGDASGNDYNEAINANTKVNANGGNWYYPWYAATAGQGTNTASPTISQSICPKSWKLPNGGTNAAPSFQSLATAYSIGDNSAGSTKLQSVPLSFYYTGYYSSGQIYDNSYGYKWSANPNTNDNIRAYSLSFRSDNVYSQHYIAKFYGIPVRCVAIP